MIKMTMKLAAAMISFSALNQNYHMCMKFDNIKQSQNDSSLTL